MALAPDAVAAPKHGLAMHGEPALPPDFAHLPYANPGAPRGGRLNQAMTGTFDSTNPFIVFGQAVTGVRTYTFESLLGRNWEEPFALYGLLAETVDVSPDFATVTFRLRPEAKFSDGKQVTSADVVFSLETLRDHGRPNFKNAYSKVVRIETPDPLTVVFHQEAGDRELPMIIGLMPILPKHAWEGKDFEKTTLEPLIGSGPYIMTDIRAGEGITYKRNPDYWGDRLPINRGLWNFDVVRYDYFRDSNATFEAFKKGLVDIRIEADPTRWSTGYDFPAVKSGQVILEKVAQRSPAAASGFAFNTRRPVFADRRVRAALIYAFDFEWANKNLFFDLYRRTEGYYGGSELSSFGRAGERQGAGAARRCGKGPRPGDPRRHLPLAEKRRFGPRPHPISASRSNCCRKLDTCSTARIWSRRNRARPSHSRSPSQTREQEKIALFYQRNLKQLGVEATIRTVDSAQFQRMQQTYDYDMIPATWYNSLSPGNEQMLYFGGTGRAVEGTRNYPGIADPACRPHDQRAPDGRDAGGLRRRGAEP